MINKLQPISYQNFEERRPMQEERNVFQELIDSLDMFVGQMKENNKSTQVIKHIHKKVLGKEIEEKIVLALEAVKEEIKSIVMPSFPDFPQSFSVAEATDIIAVLNKLLKETRSKQFNVDFGSIEKALTNLERSLPKMPELPMENGRIAVILPDDQVAKTVVGKKLEQKVGQFVGGATINPSVIVKNATDQVINPATNETLTTINTNINAGTDKLSPYATCGDGTTTVTTAGTRVQLSATSVECKKVFVQAHESNTGTMVVGGSTVVATLVGRRGVALYPTQTFEFKVNNLNLLYVDSTVDGEKVNFYYEN